MEKHGVEPPAEYVALRERINTYTAIDRPLTDRLVAAVLSGEGADNYAELRSLAIAESVTSDLDEKVNTAAWAKLREIYDEVAADSYKAIAARWDALSAEFAAAVKIVSPTATADEVIELPAASQKAWKRGRELSAQLDELSVLLQTAAMLTGIQNTETNQRAAAPELWRQAQTSMLIGLSCDPGELHRRRVWEAFDQGWAALIELGVELRAADLDTYEPYRKPKQMLQRKQLRADGLYEHVPVDPEDPDYVPMPLREVP
ncbi:hypothetical protein A5741_01440 [Mycolicibacterium conceptionense]|nr:hypothetical protein A5741_01440 [Mycolicibacterium conceptionense]